MLRGTTPDNSDDDAFTLLRRAAELLPQDAEAASGVTVADLRELIGAHEWELVLYLLIESGDTRSVDASVAFWELLAEAARQAMLDRSRRWCLWRAREAEHGIFRATLRLLPREEGARRTSSFAGDGRLTPMWDLGLRTSAGERSMSVARLWVESAESLGPGETADVRLAPLTPEHWRHLEPGT